MNREILFKAKRKGNDKWVYGDLIKTDEGYCISVNTELSTYDNTDLYSTEFYKIIPETVCQYTGLVDKNGKKIFENDQVKYDYEFLQGIGVVKFNNDNASYQIKGISSSSMKHHKQLIVIGSIHDKDINRK